MAGPLDRLRTAMGPIVDVRDQVRRHLEPVKDRAREGAEANLHRLYRTTFSAPVLVVMLLVMVTAAMGWQGQDFQSSIEDDVEIFLPDGAASSDLLREVRSGWSTDIAIIWIQTDDAGKDGAPGANITDRQVLEEISWIEGDDTNKDEGRTRDRGIDHDREDHGEVDGVVWVLSVAQVIKEANSSDGRFSQAMCTHGLDSRFPLADLDCEGAVEQDPNAEDYTIPSQNEIDEFVGRASGALSSLVADTNENGVWDTAAIVIGLHHDPSMTEHGDFSTLLRHIEEVINARPETGHLSTVELTGLTKVLEDVSDAIYEDLLKMLPWSLIFTVAVVSIFHRTWKVAIIGGTPIAMALAVTFGSSVLFDLTLTPMIVAAFPILIGLGVDYSLHMLNRLEETRDAQERDHGKDALWEEDRYREAVVEMMTTTGTAVLLSALTTVIGFSVLIAPAIVPVMPIRTVGITLVIGIASTLVFSVILVPTLAWLLRFRRRHREGSWSKVSRTPITAWWLVLLICGSLTAVGVAQMDALSQPITGSSETPDDLQSIETLARYSEVFGSGQTSMFITDATERGPANGTLPIRDLPVLDAMDAMERQVNGVDQTTTISIVTFLEAIPVRFPFPGGNLIYEGSLWDLIHEECWTSDDLVQCGAWMALDATSPDGNGRALIRQDMVDVAFDTLSLEVQWMLLDEAGERALVYVQQPYMNLDEASILREEIDALLITGSTEASIEISPLAGGLPTSLDINEGIHDAQSRTTWLTVAVLTCVLMVLFGSVRVGVLTMIPVAVVVIWQPLLMRSGDVNVNIFTAMIGTIVFGIGVDDAIHVMHRIREEGETAVGIARSVERTGQTIFETTATTMAGLGAGLLVSFPGLVNFFGMMLLLIFLAFATSAFLLPSVLTAEWTLRHRLAGKPNWIDFADDLVTGIDEVMDAGLLEGGGSRE